ncbi:MAG TPA: CoA-acylating methylmalonate-semialdehyde dehydrogenase [Candidatus Dormibacteraeota bacterium]|nr:CoA-acylating methylmalonate-semialdehyde dehydrogenase [Candidatus Dormibacteraeota bacterium]
MTTGQVGTAAAEIVGIPHFVGGQMRLVPEASSLPVYDPATGRQRGSVPVASEREVDEAVALAGAAQPAWGATTLAQRAEVFFRFREILTRNADRLALAITQEHGKVLSDARGEISRGLENVEFACGLSHLLKGSKSVEVSTNIDVEEYRFPVGVAVGISPFNFPVMVPLWMICSAIACGNAFILKPSEKDPSAPVLLAELFADAGLPAGVLSVLHGDASTVNRLLDHPDVAAVSSVGSTPVARQIYQRAARHGKRVQALGGAKNHMVVLPDADLEAAADAAVSAAFGSAGERCMAISVLVAVGESADPLVNLVSAKMARLRIGAGTDPASQMGPLVTAAHRDRVASYIASGQQEGATVVVDGRSLTFEGDGFFLGATLLDHVTPDMQVYQDEIFGPVLCVVRCPNYPDALAVVNANQYGNGGAIFTRDGAAARRFCREADVGMVGINVPIPVPVGTFSFGGWKDSLFGDSHMYGPDGIHFFTRTKVVTGRWQESGEVGPAINFSFPAN